MIPYLFLFAYFTVLMASLWKLFQKAGKPAWAGFVPGYNILVWLQITGKLTPPGGPTNLARFDVQAATLIQPPAEPYLSRRFGRQ